MPHPTRPLGFNFSNVDTYRNFNVVRTASYSSPSADWIGRLRESYSFGIHCKKYIDVNNFDIIYVNAWPLFAQFFIMRAAKRKTISTIVHVQDLYPETLINKIPQFGLVFNVFFLPIDRYILKNAHMVIAISDKMKSYLVETRQLQIDKVQVVRNWQDETEFNKIKSTTVFPLRRKENFVFMYMGNIGPVAGVDLLLRAFANSGLENHKLIIAGSGSMKAKLQLEALDIEGCEFWDVPEGKVAEIQSFADVLLLPIKRGASSSSVPSKLPAYMLSGKPIICCSDEGSDSSLVVNEAKCGWTLPAEDMFELSETMKEVASLSAEYLAEIGSRGYHYAMLHFSKRENLSKLARCFGTRLVK